MMNSSSRLRQCQHNNLPTYCHHNDSILQHGRRHSVHTAAGRTPSTCFRSQARQQAQADKALTVQQTVCTGLLIGPAGQQAAAAARRRHPVLTTAAQLCWQAAAGAAVCPLKCRHMMRLLHAMVPLEGGTQMTTRPSWHNSSHTGVQEGTVHAQTVLSEHRLRQ